MIARTLLASVVLVVGVCAVAVSQPRPVTPNPPLSFSTPLPPATGAVPPPPPGSVDQLLAELESVKTQKAELDRKEKELKAALAKKLEEQAGRLKKLGIAPPVAKDAEPDRVGRIIIEGNTKTPDQKILDKLELRPGQILQFPALEKGRAALERAGFLNVSVEALPNDLEPSFKDIRIKVIEKGAR